MKHIALTALLLLAPISVQASENLLPRLHVDGNALSKPDGAPVTLRGVSLCSLEWHKPLEQIQQVSNSPAQWNVNILRLPVQVKEWHRVGAHSYIKDYLDPAIALCKRNNVYCIIDWHEIAEWDIKEVRDKLEDFWKLVAPRYANDPNILYEIFNEPTEPKARDAENWAKWRDQAQKWVDRIRKDAPETLLLVGSPHWSQMPSFAVENPVKGKNIAYTMHLYPNLKQKGWDGLFGKAAESIPLFITEWGWSNKDDAFWVIKGDEESFGAPLKEYLKNKPQVHWTAWSYDPLCAPSMLGDDKEMAGFVKQWLKEANP